MTSMVSSYTQTRKIGRSSGTVDSRRGLLDGSNDILLVSFRAATSRQHHQCWRGSNKIWLVCILQPSILCHTHIPPVSTWSCHHLIFFPQLSGLPNKSRKIHRMLSRARNVDFCYPNHTASRIQSKRMFGLTKANESTLGKISRYVAIINMTKVNVGTK
jgi:hypothetical protein